jgi:hypothetical protein
MRSFTQMMLAAAILAEIDPTLFCDTPKHCRRSYRGNVPIVPTAPPLPELDRGKAISTAQAKRDRKQAAKDRQRLKQDAK